MSLELALLLGNGVGLLLTMIFVMFNRDRTRPREDQAMADATLESTDGVAKESSSEDS